MMKRNRSDNNSIQFFIYNNNNNNNNNNKLVTLDLEKLTWMGGCKQRSISPLNIIRILKPRRL
jgi:hypothetical protein